MKLHLATAKLNNKFQGLEMMSTTQLSVIYFTTKTYISSVNACFVILSLHCTAMFIN